MIKVNIPVGRRLDSVRSVAHKGWEGQPRDKQGRWTSGGSGLGSINTDSGNAKLESGKNKTEAHSPKSFREAVKKVSAKQVEKPHSKERQFQHFSDSGELKLEKLTGTKTPRAGWRSSNIEDISQKLADDLKISPSKAQEMVESIDLFTSGMWMNTTGFDAIRQTQKGNPPQFNNYSPDRQKRAKETIDSAISNLNAYIEKAPKYKGEIRRGIDFKSDTDKENFIKQISNGIADPAISSYTSDPKIAKRYAGEKHGIVLVIKQPKHATDVTPLGQPGESEKLVKGGIKMKMVGTPRMEDGRLTIDVEQSD